MCAHWAENFDATALLNRIGKTAKVQGESVQLGDSFEFHELESVLVENTEFRPEIADTERTGLVWRALVQCAKQGDFCKKAFLGAISRLENDYLSRPLHTYYLFSSWSIKYDSKLQIPELSGCRTKFLRYLPRSLDRKELEGHIRNTLANRAPPRDYTHLRVAVRARSPSEAGTRALQSLHLQRSLLNYQLNLTKGTRFFSGRPTPVNDVVPGPISTLHERNGKLVPEMFWYEIDYVAPASLVSFDELARCRRNEKWIVDKVRKHRFRIEIEEVLRRYGRALDDTDYDLAIIQLWSVLEKLGGTDRYEQLVKRISFLYAEHEHHRTILNHIRRYRNRVIHAGHSSIVRNEVIHQLRRHVQDAILHHVRNGVCAGSLKEAVRLLDYPPDRGLIRKEKRFAEFALRYRRS